MCGALKENGTVGDKAKTKKKKQNKKEKKLLKRKISALEAT